MSVIRGKAENICSYRAFLGLPQNGHAAAPPQYIPTGVGLAVLASARGLRLAETPVYLFCAFLAFPSAEQGLSFEQVSPITPTAWISISIPGRAKFVTVMSALPG